MGDFSRGPFHRGPVQFLGELSPARLSGLPSRHRREFCGERGGANGRDLRRFCDDEYSGSDHAGFGELHEAGLCRGGHGPVRLSRRRDYFLLAPAAPRGRSVGPGLLEFGHFTWMNRLLRTLSLTLSQSLSLRSREVPWQPICSTQLGSVGKSVFGCEGTCDPQNTVASYRIDNPSQSGDFRHRSPRRWRAEAGSNGRQVLDCGDEF